MIVIGIDPGKKGGIAKLRALPVSGYAMSLILNVMPEDPRSFADHLRGDEALHVFIEKAQSFPGQGIASAFNYGRHFGELLGILHNVPHTLVHPKIWTKAMHEGTTKADAKVRSLEAARRLFPNYDFRATSKCKKPHDGLIDAALIALYGWRKLVGVN